MKAHKVHCNICRREAFCNWFHLYVIGSEGTWLCHACEMLVVEFIREQAMARLEDKIKSRNTQSS